MPYQMKTKPYAHQAEEWERTQEKRIWGNFWDMGTGKSKMAVDMAGALWEAKEIDGVIVVAPNSVHDQWIEEEVPTHLPDHILERTQMLAFRSAKAITKWQRRAAEALLKHDGLSWLAISYEGFMTTAGKKLVWAFMKRRKAFYVLDESHFIKTPGAKRTMSITASGRYCTWKRILSGTSVTSSPFDAYTQVKFLDENYWKQNASIQDSLCFKHRFGLFRMLRPRGGGREVEIVTGYQRLDELQGLLRPISSVILKEDVLDLPPKTYMQRYFDPSPEQRRVYEGLKQDFEAALNSGEMVTTQHVLARVTRFQQLLAGYIPEDSGALYRFDPNPRLRLLEEVLAGAGCRQTIIWGVFNEDIDAILSLLGKRAVRFDGKVDMDGRAAAKASFKAGDAQFFVSKQSAGGTGLNLTCADLMIYYNTTRNLVHRLQSEDRFHRIGQEKPVTIIDIMARGTLETGIVTALREKLNIEAQVTGRQVREWL